MLLKFFLKELTPKQILAWFRAQESEGRARREEIHAQGQRSERECGGLRILREVLSGI